MRVVVMVPLLLAACGSQKPADPTAAAEVASPPPPTLNSTARAMVLDVPKDKAQLQRLLSMGYKLHEDHLDPPGVASCPKMSENPVV